jgi:O-antigen ligase
MRKKVIFFIDVVRAFSWLVLAVSLEVDGCLMHISNIKGFQPLAVRRVAAFICLLLAWLFPYADGGSRDAWQQIFMVVMLTLFMLALGMTAASAKGVAVLLSASIIVVTTPNPYWSQPAIGIAGLVFMSLACSAGRVLRGKPEDLSWVLLAILAAALINALQGLLQWFGLVGDFYHWIAEPEGRGVAYGAFRQRNLFASFLCVGAVATLWLVYLRKVTEPMAWFLLAVLMLAVAASGSRVGMLEVLALSILGLLRSPHQAKAITRLTLGMPFLLGASSLFLPVAAMWHGFSFVPGVNRIAQSGSDARLSIWANTVDLIAERPWFGWGWRELNYARYSTLLDNRFDGLLDNAHNLPLQLAVEFGLPVTISLIVLTVWVVKLAKPWRIYSHAATQATSDAMNKSFAWSILLLILGMHSMVEYPLWSAGFLFLAALCIGYLLPTSHLSASEIAVSPWVRPLTHTMAIGLLVFCGAGLYQYDKVRQLYTAPFTADRAMARQAIKVALDNAEGAWLFQGQLDLAALGLIDITPDTALAVRALAEKLLHHSAEPRVIQPLLLSLWYLKDTNALQFHAQRFCRAYPKVFDTWQREAGAHPMVAEMVRISSECRARVVNGVRLNYRGMTDS